MTDNKPELPPWMIAMRNGAQSLSDKIDETKGRAVAAIGKQAVKTTKGTVRASATGLLSYVGKKLAEASDTPGTSVDKLASSDTPATQKLAIIGTVVGGKVERLYHDIRDVARVVAEKSKEVQAAKSQQSYAERWTPGLDVAVNEALASNSRQGTFAYNKSLDGFTTFVVEGTSSAITLEYVRQQLVGADAEATERTTKGRIMVLRSAGPYAFALLRPTQQLLAHKLEELSQYDSCSTSNEVVNSAEVAALINAPMLLSTEHQKSGPYESNTEVKMHVPFKKSIVFEVQIKDSYVQHTSNDEKNS